MTTTAPTAGLRTDVATACRVLAYQGLAADVLGHVSARLDDRRMMLRCRGPRERGLLFTDADDIRVVSLDGDGDLDGGYALPNEYPIHAELLRARPDVQAVVHMHPVDVLTADLAGVELRQVFGAYNIPAARIAEQGVPVYPRPVLVRTPELGRAVAATVGPAGVCVLRGHGIVTVGESVAQAMLRALDLTELARVCAQTVRLGGLPPALSSEDRSALPDLGSSFNDLARWRYHCARLEAAGF
jgi:ribulose-5-phosphate 4-epimerase/fuculose-1-phosphate aldolase